MKKRLLAALLLALSALSAAAAPPALPANVLAVVEAPDMNALQQGLTAFAGAVEGNQGASAGMAMGIMLMGVAKTMNAGHIEYAAPLRMLLLKSGDGAMASATVFSVKDITAFRASMVGNMKFISEKDGLRTFVQEKITFDREAWNKATAEERRNGMRFRQTTKKPFFMTETGKVVCLSSDAAAAQAVRDMVLGGMLPPTPLFAEGNLNAYVNLRALTQHLGTRPGGLFGPWQAQIKKMMVATQPGGQAAGIEKMLMLEMKALEQLLQQLPDASVSLFFGAEGLRLDVVASIVEGTPLSAYLAAMPKGLPSETLAYLPADAFIAGGMRMGDMAPMMNWVEAFMAEAATVDGKPAAELEPVMRAMRQIVPGYGDEFSLAMRPGGALRLIEVIRMKDRGAGQAAVAALARISAPLSALYQKMGMPMTFEMLPKSEVYKGRVVGQWNMNFAPPAVIDGTPEAAKLAEAQRKALTMMLGGETLTAWHTLMERDWVISLGSDGREYLHGVIDGAHPKLTETPAFAEAMAKAPPESQAVALVHVTDLISFQLGIARATGAPVPEPRFQRGPGIRLYGGGDASSLRFNMVLPTAEARAVSAGFKNMEPAPMPPQ